MGISTVRRRAFPTLVLSATLVLATSCAAGAPAASDPPSESPSGPERREVTVVTPTALGVGAIEPVTDKAGFFAAQGLDVQVTPAGGSSQAIQAVVSETALVARVGGLDLLNAISKHPDIGLVAIGVAQHGSSFEVVSTAEKPIRTPQELVGTTVGVVSLGGATEEAIDFMLLSQDIEPSTVDRVVAGNSPNAYQLVKNGKLAAVVVTSAVRGVLETNGQNPHHFPVFQYVPIPGNVFIAKKTSVEKYPRTLTALMTALHETQKFMIENVTNGDGEKVFKAYEDANLPGAENYANSRVAVENAIEGWTTPQTKDFLTVNTPEEWANSVELLKKAGKLPESLAADSVWTNAVAPVKG